MNEEFKLVRADHIKAGDRLDLEGDQFADPNGNGTTALGHYEAFEFELAVVNETTREGTTCIVLCTSQGEYGFPVDHLLKRYPPDLGRGAWVGYTVHDHGYDVKVYDPESNVVEEYTLATTPATRRLRRKGQPGALAQADASPICQTDRPRDGDRIWHQPAHGPRGRERGLMGCLEAVARLIGGVLMLILAAALVS